MNYKKYPGQKLEKYSELLNENKPLVSIVTPYYNSGKTVEETFNSIMNQTYPFFEWIIVNDGSTDKESIKKIEELVKKDKRIKYYSKENGGPSVARDYGISKSSESCKYILFLDSDDTIAPTFIECVYWSLETNPEASFAYTASVNFGEREFLWEKYLTIEQEKEENLINICSMVKKEDLLSVGCFGIKEKAMYEDWNLWLKLIKAGKKPLRLSGPLYWYRQTNSGELSRARENHQKAMKYVNETAKDISDEQVEVIQYPRYGDNHATCKEFNMILPDYKKDNRTTILYIFPWMVVGGADFFNLDLIKRLPKEKYRHIILTTTPNRNPIRQEFEEYAEVYDMASFIDRINYLDFTDYIISSRKVDLVFISNSEYGYYMAPYLKSKYPTIPFIDYIHSIDLKDPRSSFGRCTRDVDKYLYGTYCCNNFTKNQLKTKFEKEHVETIYIGTDDKKYNPEIYNKKELLNKYEIPEDKIVISFIARLSEEKRPLMFVEIAKRINEKYPNTYFVIAGNGPLMQEVKYKANKNFKLLGMVNNTEEVYAISDITINCSSLEGLALTSYESLAMSVPVISTDVGGQTELIDSTVGGIVHYNKNANKEVFETEISQYVEETSRVINDLDAIKNNCRKKIKKDFTLDIMAKKIENIFESAIESEKNRKLKPIDKTIYELACEAFNTLFFNYTNDYHERNYGVYLTAKKTNHVRFYRHVTSKLEVFGAVKEGKDIIEFLRAARRLLKELKATLINFVKAFISGLSLLYKIIKRIITKPFRNN